MKVTVKKVDISRFKFVIVAQDVTEKSVTYTVETDRERHFDWYGANGKFLRFGKE